MPQLSLFETSVLEGIACSGSTAGTYNYVANRLGLAASDMQEKVRRGKDGMRLRWQHRVRQIQQTLKSKGLIAGTGKRGQWTLTNKGRSNLTFAPQNQIRAIFSSKNGLAFWGDNAELPSILGHGSVDLICTSPPYLLVKERDYVNVAQDEHTYVETMLSAIESWLPMLSATGSIVLNLGAAIKKGSGHQSLYRERLLIELEDKLGLHLVQRFYHFNPAPARGNYWTTIAKRQAVNAIEDWYWLSLNPKNCEANNQRVLVELSEKQETYINNAIKRSGTQPVGSDRKIRPSGHSADENSFYKPREGAIPTNLLIAPSRSKSDSAYRRFCKENDLPVHNAMFNDLLPNFFIRLLTTAGQVVLDNYSGTGNTGLAAEDLDRYWFACDITREYVYGHAGRMKAADHPITFH